MQWPTILWLCCYTLVAAGLSAFGIHRWYMVWLFWRNLKNVPRPLRQFAPQELPFITVQLPVYNESLVVPRLLRAVEALQYPKDRLEIQILDDSTDETRKICEGEAARLKAAGYQVLLQHRTDRTGFKAGALEKGMERAAGELIYILDADFVPPPGVLHEMVHFFTDPQVAVVQTRWGHLNRDYSALTRAQAVFLDGHLVVEQVARSRTGRFINFNGTAGMWRREAIVDAGGWDHDTLTEDLDLSYRAQLRGWKFVFLKDIVSPAELPVDITGFKSQQFRWTKGSIQCCKKILGTVWRSKVPLKIKIEASVHLGANYAYFLIFLMMFLVVPGAGAGFTLGGYRGWLFDLPVFLLTTGSIVAFYLSSQLAAYGSRGVKNMIYLPVLLGIGIGLSLSNGKGVIEAMLGRTSAFIRTPKYGIDHKGQKWQKSSRPVVKSLLGLEILFSVYFTVLVIFGILNNYWSSLPFLLMFMLGFWYVAAGSMPQPLQNQHLRPEEETESPVTV